ncbi:MAG: ribosome-associated translation inhibitor RaiA [Deltaproteobacteria bacterium]|nr:ribosome-associated translation inhibitor RaiA [Deltaproteobacteria bacterium]
MTFRHMEPSERLKDYSHDKLTRLEKYLDAVIDAEVVLTVEKFRHRAEVLIVSDGLKIKAEEETEDMYAALDMVVDKLEKQIKRHREKLKARKGAGSAAKRGAREHPDRSGSAEGRLKEAEDLAEAEGDLPIDRRQTVRPESLTLPEAGARLAATAAGLVVFINAEDGRLSILRQVFGGRLELVTIEE